VIRAVEEQGPRVGVLAVCMALAFARATFYRRRAAKPRGCRRPSPRALSAAERDRVLKVLLEPRFADLVPAEVHATLLDEGTYLCSERTMYRPLDRHDAVRERREPNPATVMSVDRIVRASCP
jgi:putative transposase